MKLFAIITAGLMAATGAAYVIHSDLDSPCCKLKNAPVAKTGGCCSTDTAKPECCTLACSACVTDCLACCDVCEMCCTAGAQAPVTAKLDCCTTGEVCCAAGAACCPSGQTIAPKPVAVEEECCPHCNSPAKLGVSAATAGISLR